MKHMTIKNNKNITTYDFFLYLYLFFKKINPMNNTLKVFSLKKDYSLFQFQGRSSLHATQRKTPLRTH
jgi:hypothetical protein